MHFWMHCRPGCLVALADSEGYDPSPSLQVAEMITLITGLQEVLQEPLLSQQLLLMEGIMIIHCSEGGKQEKV